MVEALQLLLEQPGCGWKSILDPKQEQVQDKACMILCNLLEQAQPSEQEEAKLFWLVVFLDSGDQKQCQCQHKKEEAVFEASLS